MTRLAAGVFAEVGIIPRGAKLTDLDEQRLRLIGLLVDLNLDLAHLGF